MGIVDFMLPGRRRRNLDLSIHGVSDVARSRVELDGLDRQGAALWKILCGASQQTLHQLLIKPSNSRMDWGLRKHIGRVSDPALVVLFWWMLLYQIVVFRNRGFAGYEPEREIWRMFESAENFVKSEWARLAFAGPPPGPWSANWNRQFPLESAMEFYNATYDLLGLTNNLTQRISHVSYFTSLTEQAYDRLIAESFS